MKRGQLEQGFLLFVPAGAHVQPVVNLAGRSDFEHLVRFIAEQRSPTGPFGDWLQTELDCSDPEAREESTRLHQSYLAFCRARAVAPAQYMSATAFGLALNRCGIERRKNRHGRVLRLGCRLKGDGGLTDG